MAWLATVVAFALALPLLSVIGCCGSQGLICGGVLLPSLSLCMPTLQSIGFFADLVDKGVDFDGR